MEVGENLKSIDEHILADDNAICENIDDLEHKTRDKVAQNMLSYFRNLVEHIAVKIYAESHENAYIDYDTIPFAIEFLKSSNEFYFLRKFHQLLQESRSHYTPDNDGAERLLLKYYEYLIQIKDFVYKRYRIEVLRNIDKFPVDNDETLQIYYEKIIEKLKVGRYAEDYEKYSERFYVQKIKPFFVDHHVYYENTLIPANDESSKFNRLVAFSNHRITTKYAIKVALADDIIEISGRFMPIKIVTEWGVSIRPCEFKNYAKIFNLDINVRSDLSEYIALMNYITKTGLNLVEILEFSDLKYQNFKDGITQKAQKVVLCDVFDKARGWIRNEKLGSNCIRYLLYTLNNRTIKMQLSDEENYRMKGLYLDIKTIPFEEMPFNSGLCNHNPSIYNLLSCLKVDGREHEILAHRISVNADTYGKLYTKKDELNDFQDIDVLIQKYNDRLYWKKKHQDRRLETLGDNIYIRGYESDTKEIIQTLVSLTEEGVMGYKDSVEDWLLDNSQLIDSDEKRDILLGMFENSNVAMIYGAAGTGKSTLIKHIAQFWEDSNKVYIANTHPAVENLRRKVKDNGGEYLTIKKFINSYPSYRKIDILFIDECSMVSNKDMLDILNKNNYDLLVLVGDIYQIESIQFGNWFGLARYFVPLKAQYELVKPYRTDDKYLLEFWRRVRNYQADIAEWMGYCGYTSQLDDSLFDRIEDDEIVLCLNYDGLYGINNINRFLQNANPNPPYKLGVWIYKIGDPILFNDSSKYDAILYNNLKGTIVNIEENEEYVWFSIEIDKVLNGIHVARTSLELLPRQNDGKSIVRLAVKKKKAGDDDNIDAETSIPFQIAYAVSIHKAQGLEYDSVKIVITKEVDEMITHNIFYTAITRTKKDLKIYWTAESQHKIIDSFVNDETSNDAKIFAARTGIKMIKRKGR